MRANSRKASRAARKSCSRWILAAQSLDMSVNFFMHLQAYLKCSMTSSYSLSKMVMMSLLTQGGMDGQLIELVLDDTSNVGNVAGGRQQGIVNREQRDRWLFFHDASADAADEDRRLEVLEQVRGVTVIL